MYWMNLRKKTAVLLTSALIAFGAVAAVPASAAAVTVYEENFNNIATGKVPEGYKVKEENGKVHVVEVPSAKDKSLYFEDKDASGNYQQRLDVNLDEGYKGIVTTEIKFMIPEYSDNTRLFRLLSTAGAVGISVETTNDWCKQAMRDDCDGQLNVRPEKNGKWVTLTKFKEGQWHTLKIVANTDSQTADYYVDGKLAAQKVPFMSNALNIGKFDSFTPGGGAKSHYINYIKITHGEEAAAPAKEAEPAKSTAPAAPANSGTPAANPAPAPAPSTKPETSAGVKDSSAVTEPVVPTAMPKTGMGGASETVGTSGTTVWLFISMVIVAIAAGVVYRFKASSK